MTVESEKYVESIDWKITSQKIPIITKFFNFHEFMIFYAWDLSKQNTICIRLGENADKKTSSSWDFSQKVQLEIDVATLYILLVRFSMTILKSNLLSPFVLIFDFYSPQMFEANLKPTLFFFLLLSFFLLLKTFRENQECCVM